MPLTCPHHPCGFQAATAKVMTKHSNVPHDKPCAFEGCTWTGASDARGQHLNRTHNVSYTTHTNADGEECLTCPFSFCRQEIRMTSQSPSSKLIAHVYSPHDTTCYMPNCDYRGTQRSGLLHLFRDHGVPNIKLGGVQMVHCPVSPDCRCFDSSDSRFWATMHSHTNLEHADCGHPGCQVRLPESTGSAKGLLTLAQHRASHRATINSTARECKHYGCTFVWKTNTLRIIDVHEATMHRHCTECEWVGIWRDHGKHMRSHEAVETKRFDASNEIVLDYLALQYDGNLVKMKNAFLKLYPSYSAKQVWSLVVRRRDRHSRLICEDAEGRPMKGVALDMFLEENGYLAPEHK